MFVAAAFAVVAIAPTRDKSLSNVVQESGNLPESSVSCSHRLKFKPFNFDFVNFIVKWTDFLFVHFCIQSTEYIHNVSCCRYSNQEIASK